MLRATLLVPFCLDLSAHAHKRRTLLLALGGLLNSSTWDAFLSVFAGVRSRGSSTLCACLRSLIAATRVCVPPSQRREPVPAARGSISLSAVLLNVLTPASISSRKTECQPDETTCGGGSNLFAFRLCGGVAAGELMRDIAPDLAARNLLSLLMPPFGGGRTDGHRFTACRLMTLRRGTGRTVPT